MGPEDEEGGEDVPQATGGFLLMSGEPVPTPEPEEGDDDGTPEDHHP